MLNITNYQRSVNQNYSEESLHTGQNGHHYNIITKIMNAGEGLEKRELSYNVAWNVNWYKHYGDSMEVP